MITSAPIDGRRLGANHREEDRIFKKQARVERYENVEPANGPSVGSSNWLTLKVRRRSSNLDGGGMNQALTRAVDN